MAFCPACGTRLHKDKVLRLPRCARDGVVRKGYDRSGRPAKL